MPQSLPSWRKVAVAIPAKDEETHLPQCLAALDQAAQRYAGNVILHVLANNCSDRTNAVLRHTKLSHAELRWSEVSLLEHTRHAGWARRLALDEAAALLADPKDVLESTDADSTVARDWITRTLAHIDSGVQAVAGRAFTRPSERRQLGTAALQRLNLLQRYQIALDWLRADELADRDDPWPRHFYEGGASIALTLETYRRIGGAPTPPVAEDRALFNAVREAGGRVRHPIDVQVFTSSRTHGRARGGMADAVAQWITQPESDPLHETYGMPVALFPANARAHDRLNFLTLPAELARVQAMIRARRSGTRPQVEPIAVASILDLHGNVICQEPA
ncbi:glycosyltransferase family 2 protein (plasmid) [Novosphingobium sp. BL-8A]|uniref:glycosyltransferase n=1 Tax=Novosphingobium sp. BL-8A TaxID=3127639 RepID=UPI00375725B4